MNPVDISVVIPCFNEAANPLLEKTLHSILNQETRHSFEIVVVDDGSGDDSGDRIARFLEVAAGAPPYRIIRNKLNQGIARALNRGIQASRGRYILRIDCGDIALPARMDRQVAYLERHSAIALAGGLAKWINHHEKVIGEYPFNSKIQSSNYNFRNGILYRNCLVHTTWIVRRELYTQIGYYDSAYVLEDYEFLVRAISSGHQVAIIPEYLTLVYINQDGLTGGVINNKKIQKSIFRMKRHYIGRLVSVKNLVGLLKSGIGYLLLTFLFPLYLKLARR